MRHVHIMIGAHTFELEAQRSADQVVHSFHRALKQNEGTGAYVLAELTPVHRHGCPSTRNGRKHGPCDCGAEAMFDELLGEEQIRSVRKPWKTPRL